MTAQELFGVFVRAIGLILFLAGFLAILVNPLAGVAYALVGLLLIAGANWVVVVCYAPKWSLLHPRTTQS